MKTIKVKEEKSYEKEIEKARKEGWHKVNWDATRCWCYARNGRCMKTIILILEK